MEESISKETTLAKIQHHKLASYSISGEIYNISRCIKEDIPVHSERVYQFWKDKYMQISAMEMAIVNNTAFKLIDKNNNTKCFFYGIPQDKKSICGMSFWCSIKLYASVGYMFIRDHTSYSNIFWHPHNIHNKMPLSYLIDNRVITDYLHRNIEYVNIKIPSTKIEKLLYRKKIKYNIYEV